MGRALALEQIETHPNQGLSLTDADQLNTTVEQAVRAAVPATSDAHASRH
jgi:hypothetical protein